MRKCRFKRLSSLAFVIRRRSLFVRERKKERKLLKCSGVDEVVEKKRKKKSEDRDKGKNMCVEEKKRGKERKRKVWMKKKKIREK